MASHERVRRVSEQIKRELYEIIPDVIFHSKISLISITGIDLARDFKHGKVFVTLVSIDSEERAELVELLNKHHGKIRFQLAKRMTTRTVPDLTFVYDTSVEYGAKMEKMLSELVDKPRATDSDAEDDSDNSRNE